MYVKIERLIEKNPFFFFRYPIKDEMMKINALIIDTGNHRES
jgi:hypothetical protein